MKTTTGASLRFDEKMKIWTGMDGLWTAIKKKSGRVTGYLEVFKSGVGYCSVPGSSRFLKCDIYGFVEEI